MIGLFRRHPKNFGIVEPDQLYRSGMLTPRSIAFITQRYNIRTIIDLGATTLLPKQDAAIRNTAHNLGLNRFALRLKGTGEGDPNEYVRALRILARTDLRPTLVHCAAGAQRTGACIIFYRHIIQATPLALAFTEAERFGHHPKKDAVLHTYIDQWHTAIADSFRTNQPIPYAGPTARQDNRTPVRLLP